ncbi:MAG: bifunctional ornithine acetyltransferase/N-acetylglutamate synthase, partial [Planctomycetota bacterium]
EAILTTDRGPKTSGVRAVVNGEPFTICGMAKGAGMIAPHLATMLCFITTDAKVPPEMLQDMLGQGVQNTFNAITVDGDTSTNDSVLALASGASGIDVEAAPESRRRFGRALRTVMQDLAIQVVRGAEGASKLIQVKVTGGSSREDARAAARAVASSLLLKCALHGEEANWGRIVCALGYSGAWFEPDQVTVSIGAATVFDDGRPTGARASSELQGSEATIYIDLGAGQEKATMWTCDLSKEYVDINAGYAT